MQNLKSLTVIAFIFGISFFLISYKLDESPSGVYVDEAVTGYNSFSILKTGRDEYGKDFPIAFRFFGSYSPPLYVYLTTIPVYFLGLNEYSVRIVSVILGSLMAVIVYFFFKSSGWFDKKIIPMLLLLFIITPWNFFYSRTGYEIYMGFFLFNLGVLLLWIGLKKKIFLAAGITILSFSTYGSHSQIYTAPLFLAIFIIIFLSYINKKYLIYGLVLGCLLQLPHFFLLNTQAFLNKSDLFYLDEVLKNSDKIFLPKLVSIPLSFLFSFFSRLSAYFSPMNLFFNPDPDLQRSMPEISVFYNWMLIPFLAGLLVLVSKFSDNFTKLVIILCVSTVLPATLTKDPFSTQRALGLLLPLFTLIAVGVQDIAKKISFKKFLVLYIGFFGLSSVMLWRSYFVLLPSERALSWNYGYKDLAKIISKNPDKLFVIDQNGGKPSYIQLAFFLKLDPKILQRSVDQNIAKDYFNLNYFNPDYRFSNVDIRKVIWEKDIYVKQIMVGSELMASNSQAKEHFLEEIFVIKDSRGYPVLKGFLTNPEKKCRETNFSSIFCKSENFNTIN